MPVNKKIKNPRVNNGLLLIPNGRFCEYNTKDMCLR